MMMDSMAPGSFGFTFPRNLRGGHQDRIEEVPRSGKPAKAPANLGGLECLPDLK
jgi:hypothetical protein